MVTTTTKKQNPVQRLQALEKSLGGPGEAPLLVGLDEPDSDIVETLACLDEGTGYHLLLREFRGAPTLIVTTRSATPAEIAELEKLYGETDQGDGGEEDGDDDDDDEDPDE